MALHSWAFLLVLGLGCAGPTGSVTPAAWLAFFGRSVVGVRPTLRPAVGLPPAPETGWTARARTGPGYDPGGRPFAPGS